VACGNQHGAPQEGATRRWVFSQASWPGVHAVHASPSRDASKLGAMCHVACHVGAKIACMLHALHNEMHVRAVELPVLNRTQSMYAHLGHQWKVEEREVCSVLVFGQHGLEPCRRHRGASSCDSCTLQCLEFQRFQLKGFNFQLSPEPRVDQWLDHFLHHNTSCTPHGHTHTPAMHDHTSPWRGHAALLLASAAASVGSTKTAGGGDPSVFISDLVQSIVEGNTIPVSLRACPLLHSDPPYVAPPCNVSGSWQYSGYGDV
jgi:hypothetical protein